MGKKILIVQGHPDAAGGHFCHALADAYAGGATGAGHELRRVDVTRLDFRPHHNHAKWNAHLPSPALCEAQAAISWAEHLVVVCPVGVESIPGPLAKFLEQTLRPGFAVATYGTKHPRQRLAGKSARVLLTMGMASYWYRWLSRAEDVSGLEQGILGFCGIEPVHETLIGLPERQAGGAPQKWLKEIEQLGRSAG